jgi:hypothetical protein
MNLKEKTVVIDNKTYRYSKIVMLSTKDKSNNLKGYRDASLLFPFRINYVNNGEKIEKELSHFHLYFLSTDKICEGDYIIEDETDLFGPYEKGNILENNYKVVIASTNPLLNLPKPSDSFIQKYIEEYNKGSKITKVMVEYWCGEQTCNCNSRQQDCFRAKNNLIPKVDKNNQITITKVKNSWSREEVIELLLSLNRDKPGNFDCSAWISENL